VSNIAISLSLLSNIAISLFLSRVKTEVKVSGLFIGCPAAEGGENEK
jgi:hypothetical protein